MIEYSGFKTNEGDACNYVWSYTANLSDGSELPTELITFDIDKLEFKLEANSGAAQTLKVVLNGELSNGSTSD